MLYLLDAAFARHVPATASAISPFIGKGVGRDLLCKARLSRDIRHFPLHR